MPFHLKSQSLYSGIGGPGQSNPPFPLQFCFLLTLCSHINLLAVPQLPPGSTCVCGPLPRTLFLHVLLVSFGLGRNALLSGRLSLIMDPSAKCNHPTLQSLHSFLLSPASLFCVHYYLKCYTIY